MLRTLVNMGMRADPPISLMLYAGVVCSFMPWVFLHSAKWLATKRAGQASQAVYTA